jgi:subtilase family serine protease
MARSPATDPGLASAGDVSEASLDAEWINATAPSANLVYMSCDTDPDGGVASSMTALIDNNVSRRHEHEL